jgi:hypothetical protein
LKPLICSLGFGLGLLLIPQDALAGLRITAPADGTVVAPGETLTVTVAVDPGSRYRDVRVVGELIGLSGLAQAVPAPPYQFTFTMPADGIGPHRLTAVGAIGPGRADFSAPVTIDLETPAVITRLSANRARVSFEYPGQQIPLVVTGTTEAGATLDLSHSSRTRYRSADRSVATVSGRRWLTAVGEGSTTVTVAYQGLAVAIPVTVPKTIPGDFNGDGAVDQDDVNLIAAAAAANVPTAGPFDARDLNQDGVIDQRDVRRLLALCAGRCAIPHTLPGRFNSPGR